jgi:hypothetical protein
LSHTSTTLYSEPLSGPTMGLMMLLSTLQYQAPYMNPVYSDAAYKAGKAAYIESGGQKLEDNLKKYGTDQANDGMLEIGLTEAEIGILAGSVKTYRTKQINVRGPKIGFIETKLTAGENNGSIGLRWNFP